MYRCHGSSRYGMRSRLETSISCTSVSITGCRALVSFGSVVGSGVSTDICGSVAVDGARQPLIDTTENAEKQGTVRAGVPRRVFGVCRNEEHVVGTAQLV